MDVKVNKGLLQQSYKNDFTYTLLSQDSIFSKATKMFGQQTHVIGRTYEVDKTVNSSSVSTGNFLLENYEFNFDGEITVSENCPHNGSIISQNWTFNNTAKILLPLVCSLNSTKINCNSVALHSRQTEEIHLEQHHIQVIAQEKFEETKAQLNATGVDKCTYSVH